MKNIEKTFATKDLHFAAFLQLKGVMVKELDQYSRGGNGSPVYFIFDDKEKCGELESVYWSGAGEDAMINIKDYMTIIRDLKARVFSVKNLAKERKDSHV